MSITRNSRGRSGWTAVLRMTIAMSVLGVGPAAGAAPVSTTAPPAVGSPAVGMPVDEVGAVQDPGGVGPAGRVPTDRIPGSTGFVAPVAGPPVVLTPFRPPAERFGRGHRGVDLAASPGSTVRAAGAGVIVYAGQLAGRGVVSIEHASGLRTTYEPVAPSIRAGAVVTAGEPIGTLEPGHPSCAPLSCLHWGARLGPDTYVDPMLLLGRVRIRLEPWNR